MNFNFKIFIYLLLLAANLLVANNSAAEENFEIKIKKVNSLISSDLNSAVKLLAEIETTRNKLKKEQIGQLLIWKAVAQMYLGKNDEAHRLLSEAEELVVSIEDLSYVYRFQMTSYLAVHDYKRALYSAKKQIKVIDHLVDPKNQRDAYTRMANFYFNIGAFNSSQRYVNKAVQLLESPTTPENCFLKILSSANELEIKSGNNIEQLATETIALCKSINYELGVSLGYRTLGQYFLENNLLLEAEEAILESLNISQRINFMSVLKNSEGLLAKTYWKMNKFQEAKDFAAKVLVAEDDQAINTAKEESYRILADIYSQEGDYKQAFEASKQAQKYQQLIYDDEKIKTLAYEAAKFDVEELEDFIQKNENTAYISSGREQSQIDKEMDLIYNNTILQYLLLLLGTTVFTSTYIGVNSYRRNRYNKLTGLLRHDAAMRKSRDFFHDAMYRKNGFAVISLDVNQLKDINRILGHERADWVLTVIADAIKKFTRFKKAFGCYSGGGSFYVYMELKQDQDAVEMAQQLIEQFDSCNTAESLKLFKITASVGIASTKERLQGVNEKEICRRADVALHVAKEYAGNEIVHYQESFDAANDEYKKQMRFVQFIDPKLMVRAHTL